MYYLILCFKTIKKLHLIYLFTSADNTWEPEENLDCPDLIADYEQRLKQKTQKRKPESEGASAKKKKVDAPTSSASSTSSTVPAAVAAAGSTTLPSAATTNVSTTSSTTKDIDEDTQPRGFDRGLIPEKIIGATDSSGELMFLMKWKNSDEADLVPAKLANIKCPQIVIQFYEERLTWHTNNEEKDDKKEGTLNETTNSVSVSVNDK